MEQLRRYRVVSLAEYDPLNPEHAVITFDGVYENVFLYAFPILKKLGFPFELFITGNFIGKSNEFDQNKEPPAQFASSHQLETMAQEGGRLQWHSMSHMDLSKTEDVERWDNELNVPAELRELDPRGFRWFAYPHGKHTPALEEHTKRYFHGALSCVDGNGGNRYKLNRITVTNETSFSKSTVSLIIANYNYGHFAAEAIESALCQTVPPDEILFIDDCSGDNSMEVAERYRDGIRIVRNEKNLGVVGNFNKAVSLTKGDYICFLGADNRFRSDYVERCKLALDTNENAAVAYTNLVLFGPRAEIKKIQANGKNVTALPDSRGFYLREFPDFDDEVRRSLREVNVIHGSSMYRRSAFEEVGGYRHAGMPEDHNLFSRMVDKGWSAVQCGEFLLEYRQHSPGQVNNQTAYGLELASARKQLKESRSQISRLGADLKSKDKTISRLEEALKKGELQLQQISDATERMKDALPSLEKIMEGLERESISAALSVKAGELCYGLGLSNSSRRFFEKALETEPENVDAINNLGVLHFQSEYFRSAKDFFLRALQLDPNNEEARLNLSQLPEMPDDPRPVDRAPSRASHSEKLGQIIEKYGFPFCVDLGCGAKPAPGYVGIDMENLDCVDIVCDVTKGIPLPDESVKEMRSIHFFEHISGSQIHKLVDEVYRVLVPGATLYVRVPYYTHKTAFYASHLIYWNKDYFDNIFVDVHGFIEPRAKYMYSEKIRDPRNPFHKIFREDPEWCRVHLWNVVKEIEYWCKKPERKVSDR
jgi:glycosyltransferase involved in cell wall biosynthesis/predicted SAM-dependent methyltransferase